MFVALPIRVGKLRFRLMQRKTYLKTLLYLFLSLNVNQVALT
ncbi:hypothetical protein VCRA2112O188_130088 [Vibrio crassostreae]|nr:hypothetical protein VCRA2113O218_110067 [Vibrio crassostreae]CAK1733941.1 hypothetical protein VCRA2113O202_120089 [Vibrio crassostreae]CAK1751827.1 hypothetical protein VCRA2112O188_130088 [Vibrio crassostreae]CAK2408886.1 hypothetical protein VCRA2113O210_130088 [Vibrio crassostreae]CAK2566998.1 hypothetical protein VCRA2113O208_140089 [Vibrio crassostreae]